MSDRDRHGYPTEEYTTTHTLWAIRVDCDAGGQPGPHILNTDGKQLAKHRLEWWRDRIPGANPTLMRREVTTTYTAWAEDGDTV